MALKHLTADSWTPEGSMGRISKTMNSYLFVCVWCVWVRVFLYARVWACVWTWEADVNCLPSFLCLSTLIFEMSSCHWSWSSWKGWPSRLASAGVAFLPFSSLFGCYGPQLRPSCFTQPAISPAFHNHFLWRNRDNISRSGTNIFRLSIRKYLEIWLEKKTWVLWNFLYCLWQYPLI